MAFTFGSPFLINTQPVFDQDNVSLAGLANGLFVAVYEAKISRHFWQQGRDRSADLQRGRQQARRRNQRDSCFPRHVF